MKKITLLYSMILLGSTLLAQPLYFINPANGHHHLNDISFLASGEGIAVANHGVILHYNGTGWTQAESPVTDNLNAVEYCSPDLAWAVGDNGTILKFNGTTWQQQFSPVNHDLSDLCFTDENHGWAVGNAIISYTGETWQTDEEASGLTTVSFSSPEEGWAAGLYNTLYHYTNGNWEPDFTFATGNYIMFSSVNMSAPADVLLNGSDQEGYGLLYHFDGNQWQPLNAGGINSGLSMTGNTHGFGIQNRIAFFTDTYPSVYRFTGDSRIKEASFAYNNLLTSVEATGENEAYVCDTTGFIYYGLNADWGVSNGFTADSILDISFTRANNGYFACGAGGIWHYGAGNWNNMLKVEGFRFNNVQFTDETNGWASAYKIVDGIPPFNVEVRIYNYEGGEWVQLQGESYEEIFEPVSSLDISLMGSKAFSSGTTAFLNNEDIWSVHTFSLNDSITALQFMDPVPVKTPAGLDIEEAWLCMKQRTGEEKGSIYFRDIISNMWNLSYETATGGFNDLCVADYLNIYAVGDHGLIAHFDGQNWSETAPVTTEDLISVYINDEDEGWACGKNGTLLKYNGISWSVEQSNTWNDLLKVSMLPDGTGLTGGSNGTLLCTLPQLPVANQYAFSGAQHDFLSVNPNPAGNHVLIGFDAGGNTSVRLQITDLTGRLLQAVTFHLSASGRQEVSLDTGSLHNGVYIVSMVNGSQLLTGKIVVQR